MNLRPTDYELIVLHTIKTAQTPINQGFRGFREP
nr:MAG TPA: hypothetical protein [Caudoviricetes sp.]